MTISFDDYPPHRSVVSDRRSTGLTMAALAAYVILVIFLMILFASR